MVKKSVNIVIKEEKKMGHLKPGIVMGKRNHQVVLLMMIKMEK